MPLGFLGPSAWGPRWPTCPVATKAASALRLSPYLSLAPWHSFLPGSRSVSSVHQTHSFGNPLSTPLPQWREGSLAVTSAAGWSIRDSRSNWGHQSARPPCRAVNVPVDATMASRTAVVLRASLRDEADPELRLLLASDGCDSGAPAAP